MSNGIEGAAKFRQEMFCWGTTNVLRSIFIGFKDCLQSSAAMQTTQSCQTLLHRNCVLHTLTTPLLLQPCNATKKKHSLDTRHCHYFFTCQVQVQQTTEVLCVCTKQKHLFSDAVAKVCSFIT